MKCLKCEAATIGSFCNSCSEEIDSFENPKAPTHKDVKVPILIPVCECGHCLPGPEFCDTCRSLGTYCCRCNVHMDDVRDGGEGFAESLRDKFIHSYRTERVLIDKAAEDVMEFEPMSIKI